MNVIVHPSTNLINSKLLNSKLLYTLEYIVASFSIKFTIVVCGAGTPTISPSAKVDVRVNYSYVSLIFITSSFSTNGNIYAFEL